MSRRQGITRAGGLLGAVLGGAALPASTTFASATSASDAPFLFCFNTGTIRGQKLGLLKEIQLAAETGYQAIEPWVESLDQYARSGGSLSDLKRRLQDLGLAVPSAISFPEWVVDDDTRRARGLERARREMELVAQIGGQRIATPPAGATQTPGLDLTKAAQRYRALLELGDSIGVVPQLELWGFSKNLQRLAEAAFVALDCGHPKACILADVFHLYKGGSDFHGLRLLSADALPVFHLNDYPAEPPRDQINDSHRVLPGDGVAPLTQILRDLRATGGQRVLSLELFSQKYWEQDARQVAQTGLAKMKAVVAQALS
jgi:sugar phosphate isomerase/epimerase